MIVVSFLSPFFTEYGTATNLVVSKSPHTASATIIDKEIRESGHSRKLYFKMEVSGLKSSSGLRIIPVYVTGEKRVKLPALLLNGRSRSRFRHRERTLSTYDELVSENILSEETVPSKSAYVTDYLSELPFEENASGKIYVEVYEEDCCEMSLLRKDTLETLIPKPEALKLKAKSDTSSLIERFRIRSFSSLTENMVSFERPSSENEKIRRETLDLYLNYKLDSHEILSNFEDNFRELARLDSAMSRVSSGDYEIKEIIVTGYASIEAPFDYNLSLSEHRSKELGKYILLKYPFLGERTVYTCGKGEDWDGLHKIVSAGAMPYREDVLSIISKVGIREGREKRLLELHGGVPYKYMQNKYFPALRRSEVSVEYKVRRYEPSEIAGIYAVRPKDLSREEIYELARSRVRSRSDSDYGKEYTESARMNSGDVVSLVNAFSVSLLRGDLLSSRHYAERLREEPRAYNDLGVYHRLLGEEEMAAYYFKKAISSGYSVKEARTNLESMSSNEFISLKKQEDEK